jgi:hypothetical protein
MLVKYSLLDTTVLPSALGTGKTQKKLVKLFPSVTLGKEDSMNYTSVTAFFLSIFCRALSKVFAECQLVLDKKSCRHDAK